MERIIHFLTSNTNIDMKRYLGMLLSALLSLNSSFGQLILMQPVDDEVCSSDTAQFTVMVVPNVSLQWYYATDTTSIWSPTNIGVSGAQTTELKVNQPSMYSGAYFRVIVMDLGGGMPNDTSEIVSLTVYPNPVPVMVSNPLNFAFCEGNSITLQTMEMNPAYTYLWSTMEQTPSISVQSGGVYSVTVTDNHMCSGNTSTPLVIQHPKPTPEIVPNEDLAKFCPGKSLTLVSDSVYVSYSWSSPPGGNNMFATVNAPGTYSLTVKDFNGCMSSTSRTVGLYPPASQPSILPPEKEFCHGDSLWLVGSSGYEKYEWNTGPKNDSLSISVEATYTLTVTDSNGCTATNFADPIENLLPDAEFTTFPPNLPSNQVVTGEEITFYDASVNAGDPITMWKWNFGEGGNISEAEYMEAGISTDVIYFESGLKEVCLEVKDLNDCKNEECIFFHVKASGGPTVTISQVNNPSCLDDTFCVVASVLNLGFPNDTLQQYLDWIYDSSLLQLVSTEQSNASNLSFVEEACFVFLRTGELNIIARALQTDKNMPEDTISGYGSFFITSGNEVPRIIDDTFPSFLCQGQAGEINLQINPSSDGKIVYSVNGGNSMIINYTNGVVSIPITTSDNQEEINVLLNQIIVNGCVSDTNKRYIIPVRPVPVISISGPDTVCVDEIAYLHANGNANEFEWRINGVQPPSFTLDSVAIQTNEPGTSTYSLLGRLDGCSDTNSVKVFIADTLSPHIFGDTLVCKDQVVEYHSGNSMPIHEWLVTDGTILSQQNDEVYVQWDAPGQGSIQLTQNIGRCSGDSFIKVAVSNDNSPPLDSVEYLKGGRILVYPNPDLIAGLCYQWFKDGQPISGETFQGYVVPDGVPESQLNTYSVKVWFCAAGEACAQYITFRSESIPEPTDTYQIIVVPNPNSGEFEVRYKGLETGTYEREIIGSSGQPVYHDRIVLSDSQGIWSTNTKSLVSGVYFIRWISLSSGTVYITQMVVLP